MSGILGIYYRDGREVTKESLQQMTKTLAHRGSDSINVLQANSIGFGCCLLWTTAESLLEKLPGVDRSGNLVITADVRLDNRDELIATLNLDRHNPSKITDSQLVLAAYAKWGEDCSDRLLGDFAFAIWDCKNNKLFCARDAYGVKQLYYYCSDRLFVFATEIKAILTLSEVPRRLNETKVADYLLPFFEDREITFYRDIWRLPPAHSLTVKENRVKLRQYWSFDPDKKIRLGSDTEYAEAFAEIFTEAVRCRLRSSFTVGTLLSGGLDSSSITCTANRLLNREFQAKLPTFSAVFDRVKECDESKYINTVVARGGIDPYYIKGDRFGALSDWESTIKHQDEAYYAPNLFLHRELYREAKKQNVRVLLDGFDGDTTVSHGTAYLAELVREGNLAYLLLEVTGLASNFERSPWQLLWRHGLEPHLPAKLRRKLISKNPNKRSPNLQFRSDFVRQIDLKERLKRLQKDRSNLPKTSREAHYRRLSAGVMPFALEVADKAASAFNLEPRYPFFDRRLIEFCLALPPEQKIYRGWTRIVMRRGMEGILPPEIQWRGNKSNLGANFDRGLKLGQPQIDSIMKNDLDCIENYLNLTVLRSLYQRFKSGANVSHNDCLAIWKSLSLALWLKNADLSA